MDINYYLGLVIFIAACLLTSIIKAASSSSSDSDKVVEEIIKGVADINITNRIENFKSPKVIHLFFNKNNINVWPDVIRLLHENSEKDVKQIDKEALNHLKNHLEIHFKQSKYLGGKALGELGKLIQKLEMRLWNGEHNFYLDGIINTTNNPDPNHQDIPMVKQTRSFRKKDFWSQSFILCAMYIIDESIYLRDLFENISKHKGIASALDAILKKYSDKSGYQGEELNRRTKIIQWAIKYREDFANEPLEPLNNIDTSLCKADWHSMMNFLIENNNNAEEGLSIEELKVYMKIYIKKSLELDQNRPQNEHLCNRIRKSKELILKIIQAHDSTLRMLSHWNPPERANLLSKQAKKQEMVIQHKSFVICAFYIADESKVLLSHLKPHLDDDDDEFIEILSLESIIEEFRKGFNFKEEELNKRIFILQSAFSPFESTIGNFVADRSSSSDSSSYLGSDSDSD